MGSTLLARLGAAGAGRGLSEVGMHFLGNCPRLGYFTVFTYRMVVSLDVWQGRWMLLPTKESWGYLWIQGSQLR